MKVFSPFLNGNTTTSGSLTLPRHPISSSITNPNTGSIYHDTTDNVVKVYTGNAWEIVGTQTAPAGGGGSSNIEYVVIAGGGGGGSNSNSGGGGAGGYLSSSIDSVTSGSTFTITVGAGGSVAGNTNGGNGNVSSIAGSTITTISTVEGGGGSKQGGEAGGGGSGGGGAYDTSGASGTAGQGFAGGNGVASGAYPGGGGGGASEAGNTDGNGAGGDGKASKITGASVTRAGGGSGGVSTGQSATSPGDGGGGVGARGNTAVAQAGTANTGGGGGGGGADNYGKEGGSGVVIVAYDSGSIDCAGGIIGDAGNGRKYNQFNVSGTFNVGSTSDFVIPKQSDLAILWRPDDFASRGSSTITDLSGNGRNGTVDGATLNNTPYYTFDGSNDKIYHSLTRPSTKQTLIKWMRFDGNGTDGYSLSGWQESNSYNYVGRVNSNSNLYYYIGNNTGGEVSYTLSDGTWYMITQTLDSSGNHTLYLDTTSRATNSSINMGGNGSLPFTVGGIGSTTRYFHNGLIGIVAFYNEHFTQADVTSFYNATKTNFV